VGPFITRVRLRLPDGKPWVWTSRQHRYLGGGGLLPAKAESQIDKARWWLKVGLFARITSLVSVLFVVGSAGFAAASAAGLVPWLFSVFADSPFVVNLAFFVGSIFFTLTASLL